MVSEKIFGSFRVIALDYDKFAELLATYSQEQLAELEVTVLVSDRTAAMALNAFLLECGAAFNVFPAVGGKLASRFTPTSRRYQFDIYVSRLDQAT